MLTSELFSEEQWNYLKKLILSLSNNSIHLEDSELFELFDSLPNSLKFHAILFGFDDMEVKNSIKKYLKDLL